ncbi:MAG: metallophosphoesterase [Candidatus Altiarchaeota archaeon]
MIGIMADTHDHVEATTRAVELFNDKKVSRVVHAGDLVSPFTAEPLKKLRVPITYVYGNNERERERIRKKMEGMDVEIGDCLEIEYKNIKIVVYHGENPIILNALIRSKEYDVVVTAHSHQPEVSHEEGVLVINPGEVCGHLTGRKTVAILDTEKLEVEIHDI